MVSVRLESDPSLPGSWGGYDRPPEERSLPCSRRRNAPTSQEDTPPPDIIPGQRPLLRLDTFDLRVLDLLHVEPYHFHGNAGDRGVSRSENGFWVTGCGPATGDGTVASRGEVTSMSAARETGEEDIRESLAGSAVFRM